MADCIFCDISKGQTDTDIIFRDDRCFAIHDKNPQAPTHVLIIPFTHITSLSYMHERNESLIGHLFLVAEHLATREKVNFSGYRLVINQGTDAGQAIEHLHLHMLGGKPLPHLG